VAILIQIFLIFYFPNNQIEFEKEIRYSLYGFEFTYPTAKNYQRWVFLGQTFWIYLIRST